MKISAFRLSLLLILIAPGVMAQQPAAPNQSWDVLRQLQSGEKLKVERKIGKKKFSGKFVSLSDTELVIERKRKNESFGRDEVKNIWRVTPPSRTKQMIFGAIGGYVGGSFGLIGGLAIAFSFGDCGDSCAGESIGAGVLVGGLLAAGGWAGDRAGRALAGSGKRTLIYSAP